MDPNLEQSIADDKGRVDKSEGGSRQPARADPGGVETGAKRTGAALMIAVVAVITLLVVFGLFSDIL